MKSTNSICCFFLFFFFRAHPFHLLLFLFFFFLTSGRAMRRGCWYSSRDRKFPKFIPSTSTLFYNRAPRRALQECPEKHVYILFIFNVFIKFCRELVKFMFIRDWRIHLKKMWLVNSSILWRILIRRHLRCQQFSRRARTPLQMGWSPCTWRHAWVPPSSRCRTWGCI